MLTMLEKVCPVCNNVFLVRKGLDAQITCGRGCGSKLANKDRPRTPDSERFMKWVKKNPDNECWEWQGACHKNGYGVSRANNKNMMAHRAAWVIFKGAIPEDMNVLHKCDNRKCVNYEKHLWLGTRKENTQDMISKNRGGWITHPEARARGDRHFTRTKPERIARGERQGSAKLTREQVEQIRNLYATGSYTHKQLSQMFGVYKGHISLIINFKVWNDQVRYNS